MPATGEINQALMPEPVEEQRWPGIRASIAACVPPPGARGPEGGAPAAAARVERS